MNLQEEIRRRKEEETAKLTDVKPTPNKYSHIPSKFTEQLQVLNSHAGINFHHAIIRYMFICCWLKFERARAMMNDDVVDLVPCFVQESLDKPRSAAPYLKAHSRSGPISTPSNPVIARPQTPGARFGS